jgi:hypothetical protein
MESHIDTSQEVTQGERQQQGPVFDEAQQKHISKIINRRVTKLERQHDAELTKLREERDAATSGKITESSEIARLKADRDAAHTEVANMKQQKALAIVHAAARKQWRGDGMPEDKTAMADFALFISADDEGEPVVLDHDGKPRVGVTVPQFLAEVREKYPMLRSGASDASNPRNPSGGAQGKTKADFPSYKEKTAFIDRYGLPAWEALPVSRKK